MRWGGQTASLVLRPFCYGFDSSQARKTVRWRPFRGPGFAPENGAKLAAFATARPVHKPDSARQRQPPNRSKSHRLFRYGFDNSQARQTVRWRHFCGLEFDPENEAKRAPMVHACLAAFGLLCQTMNRTPFASVCDQSFSDRLFSAFSVPVYGLGRLQATAVKPPRKPSSVSLLIQ